MLLFICCVYVIKQLSTVFLVRELQSGAMTNRNG